MTWFRIMFQDAMTHVVHGDRFEPLVTEMAARGAAIMDLEQQFSKDHARAIGGNPKVVSDWCFDIGGMVLQHAPYARLELDGLEIGVRCDQFQPILEIAKKSPVRTFACGQTYHKLKLWLHATVVTEPQHAALVQQMELQRVQAARMAYEFAMSLRTRASSGGVH